MANSAVRIVLYIAGLLAGIPAAMNGQNSPEIDSAIRISVEEVRVDAVVLDKKEHQVSGLTAGDFELFQDGKPQKITSCIYIANSLKSNVAPSPGGTKAAQMVSTPMLSRQDVRRTIAFLYNQSYEAQMGIRKFVESGMETGDLVTILGAGVGVGAFQKFSSDKRELLARIKDLRITMPLPNSRPWDNGMPGAVYVPADASLSSSELQSLMEKLKFPTLTLMNRPTLSESEYIQYLKGQIASIRYSVRALQDMPGRKYLIFMSNDIYYDGSKYKLAQERLFNEAANEALRAGVVIFTLDTKGLTVWQKTSASDKHLPLSRMTGGTVTENSNFFIQGIKPVEEAIRGYYLLSYLPPMNTFDENKPMYHRIRVKVKRSGSTIHTRDGFFGSTQPSNFAAVKPTNTLQQAIFSPFRNNDLEVSLSSSYAHAPTPGYFIGSWLHLNGKELTFKQEPDGRHLLSIELAALTSDSSGRIQDSIGFHYDFRLNDSEFSQIRKRGMDLNAWLPLKNPGEYYVRAAIRDKASGKIGSGYQYLEIPDLSRSRLALSSIFILNQASEIADAVKSGKIENGRNARDSMQYWQAMDKSPALRRYLPGESIEYMSVLYNAKTKRDQRPRLELAYTIFKDGKEFIKGDAEEINLEGIEDPGRIQIAKRLTLDNRMPEGIYLFQLAVIDKQNKSRTAVQVLDFEIRNAD